MAETTPLTISKSGTPDYATIALWEADADVSSDRWIGEIVDNSEYLNENIVFNGITGTPTADRFMWLRAASGNAHAGVSGSTHARIRDTSGHVLTIHEPFTVIEGLEIIKDSTGNSNEGIRISNGALDFLGSRLIVRATTGSPQQDGVYAGNYAARVCLSNTLIYGFGRGGGHAQNHAGNGDHEWNVDSCGFYNNGLHSDGAGQGGIASTDDSSGSNTINVFNTWALNNTSIGSDFEEIDDPTIWLGSDNIASDTSAETKFTTSFDSVALIDTDPVSGENVHVTSISGRDFNIVDEDAQTVTQNGIDRSGVTPAPQTRDTVGPVFVQNLSVDIKGVARSGWSIGPFEFVGAVENNLAATTSMAGLISSDLSTGINMSTTISNAGQIVSDLLTSINLSATSSVSGDQEANLVTGANLSAQMSAQGGLAVDLATEIRMLTISSASGNQQAGLSLDTFLGASVQGSAGLSIAMQTSILMSATATATANSSGLLSTAIRLAAASMASGNQSADLSTGIILRTILVAGGSISTDLSSSINMATNMLAEGSVSTDLFTGLIAAIILASEGDAIFAIENTGDANFAIESTGTATFQ